MSPEVVVKYHVCFQDLLKGFLIRLCVKGRTPTNERVMNDSQGPHVDFGAIGNVFENFRRDMLGTPALGLETFVVGTMLGETKVRNFDRGIILRTLQ